MPRSIDENYRVGSVMTFDAFGDGKEIRGHSDGSLTLSRRSFCSLVKIAKVLGVIWFQTKKVMMSERPCYRDVQHE